MLNCSYTPHTWILIVLLFLERLLSIQLNRVSFSFQMDASFNFQDVTLEFVPLECHSLNGAHNFVIQHVMVQVQLCDSFTYMIIMEVFCSENYHNIVWTSKFVYFHFINSNFLVIKRQQAYQFTII